LKGAHPTEQAMTANSKGGSMDIRLTYYGHSNFGLDHGEGAFLIDPFFEGNPAAPHGASEIGNAAYVLVTHDHGDHMGQALDICKATGATMVGVFDTVQKVMGQGLPEDQALGMNPGGPVDLDGVAVEMVHALHSSASGIAVGFVLTFPDGTCVYHAGDTGLFGDMALIPEFHDLDYALLPVGGRFTMGPAQAAHACKLLACRKVVPMHWGTFGFLEQDLEGFRKELEARAPQCDLTAMQPGDTVVLE
jgi:L-ascorbate metabolism protein UlaG (beta-lactamase superfamily)